MNSPCQTQKAHPAKGRRAYQKNATFSALEENSWDGGHGHGALFTGSGPRRRPGGLGVSSVDGGSKGGEEEREEEEESPSQLGKPSFHMTANLKKKAYQLDLSRRTYFHSKTCQVMTPAEVLRDNDSDDDCPEEELLQSNRHALENLPDNPTAKERQFMLLWNMFVARSPVYSDKLTPAACKGFATGHWAELTEDGDLRKCFTLHLMNLVKFGLLSSGDIQQCLRLCYLAGKDGASLCSGLAGNADANVPSRKQPIDVTLR